MERRLKPELVQQGLTNLKALYEDSHRHNELHATDLIYCLTKSWFNKLMPLPSTEEEVMFFATGWGLQMVLFPKDQQAEAIEVDGIVCSPDYKSRAGFAELKTTRMSTHKKNKVTGEKEPASFPETWEEQIKTYCYATQQATYDLLVLHLRGNYADKQIDMVGWELAFTQDELETYWEYLLERRKILVDSLSDTLPPTPYSYCKSWECNNCRYSLRCGAIVLAQRRK